MTEPQPAPTGLSEREAARRLEAHGPNQLERRVETTWPREVLAQFIHPLALLLAAAAVLALVAGIAVLATAIVVVIGLNAAVALWQERQAEHAVEALQRFLPPHAVVIRDGERRTVPASELVVGDLMLLEEGDRVSADARLVHGAVEVDMSALTGESAPVVRRAGAPELDVRALEAENLVFSGTGLTGGDGLAVVTATGMHTELGRVAALSQRVTAEESPLQVQVRHVAWLIAGIAATVGIAFLPLGIFVAGLPPEDALVFAIGLLVANVPEGLLPTITLALAVGVRQLVGRGALVKRLSAVETLGATTVICTDKTGTLTQNRMEVARLWSPAGDVARGRPVGDVLGEVLARCSNAIATADGDIAGDPTEAAMLACAVTLGADVDAVRRERARGWELRFDPAVRLMSTVDELGGAHWLHTKGAPDALLPRCTQWLQADGSTASMDDAMRAGVRAQVDALAGQGLRVLAAAQRPWSGPVEVDDRAAAERDLAFVALVALIDPPRPEVAGAVEQCHRAGIRAHVVSGDHALTATAIAASVGIGRDGVQTVDGVQLDAMSDAELDALLRGPDEVVFARSSPEAKLRIAEALRAEGHVVAMTGDGVNDAPALRRADIGVAMGLSGTEVAREAATMVLTDDDFSTIVAAVEEGRRVYDNIRKFIVYIFAHAPPEVVPFLAFALSGGAIPLPLTAVQILAIDLGTDTLPALALGREQAEPGLMDRSPRKRSERVITGAMLRRAWGYIGLISATLVMVAFLSTLLRAGWSPGDATGEGEPLHDAYLEATTMTFAAIVACQVGTAFAARTERASLRSIGWRSNPVLLWGIAFELTFTLAVVYVPFLQGAFGTAALDPVDWLILAPFPVVVWGSDELRRWWVRRRVVRPPAGR